MFTFTMALVTCLGLIYNYHVSIFLKGVPDIIDPSLSYLIFRTDDTGKTFFQPFPRFNHVLSLTLDCGALESNLFDFLESAFSN